MKYFKSTIICGLIASFLITSLFTYSLLANLVYPIDQSHGDTFHVTLTLKHYFNTVLQNNWGNILEVPMFYGFEKSLLYSELFIFEAVASFPIYLIFRDIIITYNLFSFLTLVASFFSMFLFAHFVTKRFLPSILASIIYVFNPFVIGHFPDNLHYFSLQWIPLIFLYLEKFIKDQSGKNAFLFFLFLTLQLLTTLTFGALLTVILPVYFVGRLLMTKIIQNGADLKKFFKVGAIIGALLFLITTFGVNQTYNLYFGDKSLDRSLEETAVFSPWLLDLFLTSPNNLIYGGVREWAQVNIPVFYFHHPEYIERNLFLGIGVFITIFASFFLLRKTKYEKYLYLCIICAFICILLSFGPRIRLTEDFSFPGIYGVVHKFHPLLQSLRVASRFMVLAFLFLSLVSALTFSRLFEILPRKHAIIITFAFIFIAILEYSSVPWKFEKISDTTKSFYSEVNSDSKIKVILELPMGNLFQRISLAKNQFVTTRYMLFASTLHDKQLLNGYSSYTPITYPARIAYLTVNFPSQEKIIQLKKWGVNAIILHKEEFFDPLDYERIKSQLEALGVKKKSEIQNLALFAI